MAYWHTMTGMGSDPFGEGTMERPWDDGLSGLEQAKVRVKVAFEFMEKLGLQYFCFHDRDIAPEGDTLEESNQNCDFIQANEDENIAQHNLTNSELAEINNKIEMMNLQK